MENMTLTENAALAYASTSSALLDLFFKGVRGATNLTQMLEAAWKEDALSTLKLIFQTRDCRGGKGEKRLFHDSLKWLEANHPEVLDKNLKYIPQFGTWKDILVLVGTTFENPVLNLMANQLKEDLKFMQANEKSKVSLCAKWAPSERHGSDKKFAGAARKLAKKLFPKSKHPYADYRKNYLVPLRQYLGITETFMCKKDWTNINYQAVPSRCMYLNRTTFSTQDKKRFEEYLNLVLEGKSTIKGKQMFPHELVKVYFSKKNVDPVIELQWKVLVSEVLKNGSLSDSLVLSDVSGSMSGTPMEVSIALGLLISEVTAEPFKNSIITFSENPAFHVVQGETLKDRVKNVQGMPWGGTTNFYLCFNMILERAQKHQLPPSAMPKRIFVISDMQFGEADQEGKFKTNHQVIKDKYKAAGYEMPQMIYWNVRSNTPGFPTDQDEIGVSLVSGFSPSILKLFLEKAEISEEDQKGIVIAKKETKAPNPMDLLKKVIDDERYSCLSL